MIFAMLYTDDASIVGTYKSRDEALRDLTAFVNEHPHLQDEIGLRQYENGRPVGDFARRRSLCPTL